MLKRILFASAVIMCVCSCNTKCEKQEETHQNGTVLKKVENIHFDFLVEKDKSVNREIEINAQIFNDNQDTVYFLSTSCDGYQYSLKYDTSKFRLSPQMRYNASWPVISKIAPKSVLVFKAHFRNRKNESKIKLGYNFYQVDKSFDFEEFKLQSGRYWFDLIHYDNDKNIVWACEKQI